MVLSIWIKSTTHGIPGKDVTNAEDAQDGGCFCYMNEERAKKRNSQRVHGTASSSKLTGDAKKSPKVAKEKRREDTKVWTRYQFMFLKRTRVCR